MSEETHYGTLNLHHLKVFQTVVRHLSFSRAAEELLISQSAVSMHVKSLERAVGLPLFEKVGHHIRLTAAGESLWSYSQKI
ncbi:LysR family transcriptional regulator, partial [Sulfobacillus thermosulfidooxidans]